MIIGKLDIRNGDEGEVELTTKDGMQFQRVGRAVVVILDDLKIGKYWTDLKGTA